MLEKIACVKIACIVALLAPLVGPAFSQQAEQVERTPAELEYFKEVVSLLLKARRYPPAARLIKLEGRTVVFFHVDPDGQITSRRILESSGHAMLDQAALETVDRVNPLPPFPADLKKTSHGNFAVPIRFEWR
jgi:TonB family protein